jgi:recombination DNA repair RAD52 pathway protein
MATETQQLQLVNPQDLSFVDDNMLSAKQLQSLLKHTPPQYVHTRPAKGGGTWEYVSGGYVRKVLNLMFGWNWSFEIIDEKILHGEVVVKGKLTCTSNGTSIIKMQFGNKDIIYKKLQQGETERVPLSIGNDLKAAATDALKKCAAEIGIAADIYNKQDFKAVMVDTSVTDIEDLKELFEMKREAMTAEQIKNAERIINNTETKSYKKLFDQLKAL